MATEVLKRKIKKTSRPTKTLKCVLKLINLISPGTKLPEQKIARDTKMKKVKLPEPSVTDPFGFADFETRIDLNVKRIKDETMDYPSLLEDISIILCDIREMQFDPDDTFSQLINYSEFTKLITEMWHIIAGARAIGNQPNKQKIINMHFGSIPFRPIVKLGDDGILTFEKDILHLALESNELDRLRICEVCNRVFWAYRNDKLSCSRRCNNSRRTRLLRKKNKERFPSRVKHE